MMNGVSLPYDAGMRALPNPLRETPELWCEFR